MSKYRMMLVLLRVIVDWATEAEADGVISTEEKSELASRLFRAVWRYGL